MSDKRKRQKFAAKRQQRRQKEFDAAGRLANGVELPVGAVAADHTQQVPNNSYSPPPDFYVDIEFACQDCGRREVWSAQDQKWYYEVAKGPLYATAVRCDDCRRRLREQRPQGGDPHPIKHFGGLMKRVRRAVEPSLTAAGFEFDSRNQARLWIDYGRSGMLLRVLFDPLRRGSLIAECVDEDAAYRTIASIELYGLRSSVELRERIEAFRSALVEFLDSLPPATNSVDAS